MKSLRTSLFTAAAAFALLAAPLVRAQDATPPAGTEGKAHKGPRGERLQELATKLSLTDDQKAKIKPILENEMTQMKALHEDTTSTQEQKKEKRREIMKTTHDQIKPLLTAEQLQKLEGMKGEHKKAKDAPPAPAGT